MVFQGIPPECKVSVGGRSLEAGGLWHSEERGKSWVPLTSAEWKQWVRNVLAAVVCWVDLSKDAEEKVFQGLSHTPVMVPACVWLQRDISRDFGCLCCPWEGSRGEEAEVWIQMVCNTVEMDVLHACRNSSPTHSCEGWQSESCCWRWQRFRCWHLPIWFLCWVLRATLALSLPSENSSAATFYSFCWYHSHFHSIPLQLHQEQIMSSSAGKNSSSRNNWTFWKRKMLFFMQMFLVMKSKGKEKQNIYHAEAKLFQNRTFFIGCQEVLAAVL